MESTVENVVVLVRIAGNVFALARRPTGLRIRHLARNPARPPDQSGALALLRKG